jgi:hypothetical protein
MVVSGWRHVNNCWLSPGHMVSLSGLADGIIDTEAGMVWLKNLSAMTWLLLGCGFVLSGCAERTWRPDVEGGIPEDVVSGCTAPAFPAVEGEGPFIYVAECGGEGDGSIGNPFSTLAEAAKAALDGDTIVLAEGVFQGEVTIGYDVSLVGAGPGVTFIEATLDEPVLLLHMANNLRLEGFTIRGDAPSGIYLDHCAMVTIADLVITEVGGNGSGAGLVMTGSNNIQVGNPSATLPAEGAASVTIKDITGVGIHATESILAMGETRIEGAPAGGLFMLNSRSIGQRYESPTTSWISGNVLAGCGAFGIFIAGGKVNLANNLVEETVAADNYTPAHCLAVSESEEGLAEVTLSDNEFIDCEGAGMMLQGVKMSTVSNNTVMRPAQGGIWTQMDCQVQLLGNVVDEPLVVGIALAEGSKSLLDGNVISNVKRGGMYDFTGGEDIQYAFGIMVRGPRPVGFADLSNNVVTGCEYAGILLHGTNSEELTFGQGNVTAGNIEAGIALDAGCEAMAEEQALEEKVAFAHEDSGLAGNGPTGSENVVQSTTYLPDP